MDERSDGLLRGSRRQREKALEDVSSWEIHDLVDAVRGLLDHAASVRIATVDSLLRMAPRAKPLTVSPEALAERFLGGTLAECGDLARVLLAYRSEAVDGILVRWLVLPGRHSEAEAVGRVLVWGDAASLVERAIAEPSCHKNRQNVLRDLLEHGREPARS